MLENDIKQLPLYFSGNARQPAAATMFFKGLIGLTLIKMAVLWTVSHTVMAYHETSLPTSIPGKLLLAPTLLADWNVDVFYALSLIFLLAAIFIRPNYVVAAAFFWLTFNLYVINLPFANGADLVLFMMALWCIALPVDSAKVDQEGGRAILAKAAHNLAVIMCRLQIVFIYLISGLDKMMSETWRSGIAFDYIIHLKTMYHPAFAGAFDSPSLQLWLCWITIAFELLFVSLVWIPRSRLLILAAGIFFHLFIAVVLSLWDFAATMIVSYLIFLKDDEIEILKKKLLRLKR